ncbi:MAG: hypothetical protein AAF202_03550 [Pseudomonadota bacterium]
MKKSIYLGLYLSGLKKDKSNLIVLENFEGQNRLVISKISASFKGNASSLMPDELLLREIKSYEKPVAIGVNFPTYMPPALIHKSESPGFRDCANLEIKTLLKEYKKRAKHSPKSKKLNPFPTPYIERGIDFYIAYKLEEPFPFEPAFSTNRATLLARGIYLKRYLNRVPFIECSTKASLWRIGRAYKVRKSVLRNFYRDPTDTARTIFLDSLEKDFFLYEEDRQTFIKDKNAFEALICALSAYFYKNKGADKIPAGFLPKGRHFSLPSLDLFD